MSRLKLLFFWLLAVAVPLQGFAASTQVLCASGRFAHEQAGAPGHAGGVQGAMHTHAASADDASAPLTPALVAHDCAQCAACCHAVAIAAPAAMPRMELPAATAPPAPVVPIPAWISRLPDKPPRA